MKIVSIIGALLLSATIAQADVTGLISNLVVSFATSAEIDETVFMNGEFVINASDYHDARIGNGDDPGGVRICRTDALTEPSRSFPHPIRMNGNEIALNGSYTIGAEGPLWYVRCNGSNVISVLEDASILGTIIGEEYAGSNTLRITIAVEDAALDPLVQYSQSIITPAWTDCVYTVTRPSPNTVQLDIALPEADVSGYFRITALSGFRARFGLPLEAPEITTDAMIIGGETRTNWPPEFDPTTLTGKLDRAGSMVFTDRDILRNVNDSGLLLGGGDAWNTGAMLELGGDDAEGDVAGGSAQMLLKDYWSSFRVRRRDDWSTVFGVDRSGITLNGTLYSTIATGNPLYGFTEVDPAFNNWLGTNEVMSARSIAAEGTELITLGDHGGPNDEIYLKAYTHVTDDLSVQGYVFADSFRLGLSTLLMDGTNLMLINDGETNLIPLAISEPAFTNWLSAPEFTRGLNVTDRLTVFGEGKIPPAALDSTSGWVFTGDQITCATGLLWALPSYSQRTATYSITNQIAPGALCRVSFGLAVTKVTISVSYSCGGDDFTTFISGATSSDVSGEFTPTGIVTHIRISSSSSGSPSWGFSVSELSLRTIPSAVIGGGLSAVTLSAEDLAITGTATLENVIISRFYDANSNGVSGHMAMYQANNCAHNGVSGEFAMSGAANSAFNGVSGASAMQWASGLYNGVSGYQAMYDAAGSFNGVSGYKAMYAAKGVNRCGAFGNSTMQYATNCVDSIAAGYGTMTAANLATNALALGSWAGRNATGTARGYIDCYAADPGSSHNPTNDLIFFDNGSLYLGRGTIATNKIVLRNLPTSDPGVVGQLWQATSNLYISTGP